MPRQKLSPTARRAAHARSKAQWRQRVAQRQNQQQLFVYNNLSQRQQESNSRTNVDEKVEEIIDDIQLQGIDNDDTLFEEVENDIIQEEDIPLDKGEDDEGEDIELEDVPLDKGEDIEGEDVPLDEGEDIELEDVPLDEGQDDEGEDYQSDLSYEDSIQSNNIINNEEIESSPEAQLQQELYESEQAKLNLPLILGEHLVDSFSCGNHQASDEVHSEAQEEENHWSLDDLNRLSRQLPNVLDSAKILPYNSEHRQRSYEWARLFEGRLNEDESPNEEAISDIQNSSKPPIVCIACSEEPAIADSVQYDFDSMVGFARSLAFAKEGILFNFAPQFYENLQTSVHLTVSILDESLKKARMKQVPLHKVPHIRLGRVAGTEGLNVYLAFPAQWNLEKPTNFLGKLDDKTHGVLKQWTDSILLPSIAKVITADISQHLPPSLLVAQLRSLARRHTQQARTSSIGSQQLHYHMQASLLHRIWEEILQRCEIPENALFARPFLFFSDKGTKLRWKSPTMSQTWASFKQSFEYIIDSGYIDRSRVWIDLGKETVCTNWAFPKDQLEDYLERSKVYLWRRCCTEHFLAWSRFEQPKSRLRVSRFAPAMLGDSQEITIEFSRPSFQHMQGWIYSQAYNSVKETFDIAKSKPFKASFLDKLTWDPNVRTMLEKRGKAVLATKKQLDYTYLKCKAQMSEALAVGVYQSYGIREEHRLSLTFVDKMESSLEAAGKWDQPAIRSDESLPYWQLPTETYLSHLRYNLNKFAFAFEWVLGQQQSRRLSYEHTMFLQMLLEAIRCCFDSTNPERIPALWKSSYEVKRLRTERLGMGMSQALSIAGYAWMLERVNWDQLVFRTELRDQIGFRDLALWDSYRRQSTSVIDAKDDLQKLETIGHWLALYASDKDICSRIMSFMVHFLHQLFRKDFFRSIIKLIQPEKLDAALSGKVMLCWESLLGVLKNTERDDPLARLEGLRLQHADRIKGCWVHDIVDLLWDYNDGRKRGRWDKYTYRVLYQRARELIRIHVGKSYEAKIHEFNKQQFVLIHWILPLPNTQRFWRSSIPQHRDFVALNHKLNPHRAGEKISWEELYKQSQRVEQREKQLGLSVSWMRMPAWYLVRLNNRNQSPYPLLGTPYEAAEIRNYLYDSWESFAKELEADFDQVVE